MGKVRRPIIIPLPAGSLGIYFKGTPPIITKLAEDSALKDVIKPGMVIEKLVFEDSASIAGMSKSALAEALSATREFSNRALICKAKVNSNTKKLPAGKLGITFKGTPPTITAIAETSTMRKKLKTGYVVETLILEDGTEMSEMNAHELVRALTDNMASSHRTICVDIPAPPYLAKVVLPAGKLGVIFKGSPPTVLSLAADSPMQGKVQVGTVVKNVTHADGTLLAGYDGDYDENIKMTTKEFVRMLNETQTTEGRILRLVKPTVIQIVGPTGTNPGGNWLIQKHGGLFGERDERYVYKEPSINGSSHALVVVYDENGQIVKPGKTKPIPLALAQRLSGGQMLSKRNLTKGSMSGSMRETRGSSMGPSSRGFKDDSSKSSMQDNSSSSRRRGTSVGASQKRK